MKSPFVSRRWARASLLLFVFITLPMTTAQCGSPIGRALGAIKHRVDRALNKVGVGKDREPASPDDPTPAPPQPASRQPSSKPADPSGSRAEKPKPSVAAKPPTGTRGQPQPPAASADVHTAAIKPSNGASSRPNASAGEPRRAVALEPTPIPSPAKISFAKPVPGKRGFVYPPGAEEDIKNILDVRGFTPGQKMRDPRTGEVFLVP